MENGPFEDAFPIEHGDIPFLGPMLVYWRVNLYIFATDSINYTLETTPFLEPNKGKNSAPFSRLVTKPPHLGFKSFLTSFHLPTKS